MNRDPILFRVDGTSQAGYERLYRCLTYAAALQRRRRPTYIMAQLDPTMLAFAIKRAGHDWMGAQHAAGTPLDLDETLQQVARLHPAAVIVDSPEMEESYLKELHAAGPLVVSMDSSASIRFPTGLVINPLLGPGKEAYDVAPGTQLLLGHRYALVRPEVRRARPLRALEPPQPYRILVALGDDDPTNQTTELSRLLMNCPRVGRVDAIVRSYHPAREQLQAMAEEWPGRFEVAIEPGEVTAKLSRCHLAITAGNSWSVELACVGIPQLLIVRNEVHRPTALRLEEEGVAICMGWHDAVTAQMIRQTVQDLLTDPQERQAMSRAGRRLIDGRGPDRLVTGLEILLHPGQRVKQRKAA